MNTFGEFNLFDPDTWFGGGSGSTGSTAGSYALPPTTDPFGWSSWLGGGQSTTILPGVSDSDMTAWNNYWSSGGTMGTDTGWATSSGGTQTSTTGSDFFSGLGDFFTGLTQNLPGLVQTGLATWQSVEQIIAQQNPSDKLVTLPGSNIPVVQRTIGGQTSYFPITQLYPSLTPQVQQATRAQNWLLPVVLVGALGIGFILISKKK